MKLTFCGRHRTTPLPLNGAVPVHGRLRVPLELTAEVTEYAVGPGVVQVATSTVGPVERSVDLYGPGDVVALASGSITRTSPPDGAGDVDGEFCPFVEFRAPDIPWRYSTTTDGRPWLALVAGVEDRELGLAADGSLWLSAELATALDPTGAVAWAHTQGKPPHSSRLLCVRAIPAGCRCLAAVVPLLKEDGTDHWRAGEPARGIPVYHRFRFTTNDAGSFEDLVAALHPVPRPDGLGEAELHADPDGTGGASIPMLGALAPVATLAPPPVRSSIAATIDSLLGPTSELLPGQAQPVPVVGAPRYSDPFRTDAMTPWVAQVDTDPRHRAVAGLGARAAVEWQERIMRAAGERLGQTHHAAGLLANLTLGVALSSRADRHRPKDAVTRLAFFGPALPTVTAASGQSALTHLCPPKHPLPAALLSSAAAHLLRASGATAKASTSPRDVSSPGQVVEAAMNCPEPAPSPVDHAGPFVPRRDQEAVLNALLELGEEITWDELGPLLQAEEQPDRELDKPDCTPREEGWLAQVDDALCEAFRPDGVAVDRVVHRISGLHEAWDEPLEVRPDLDLPIWDWLRRREPQWLLPRAGLIPTDGIVALRSNRAFVAACLLGASSQALAELRWRGVPVSAGAMPMRTFWQHVDSPENPAPMVDLVQPSSWPSLALDDLPGAGGSGSELVIAFRSDLVRRYPDTEVYLAAAVGSSGTRTADLSQQPIAPSFTGRLEPDVWFFGFPVPPARLPTLMLVLEEPDRGPRFHPSAGLVGGAHSVRRMTYQDDGVGVPETRTGLRDGGEFAAAAYANPIRAICDGAALLHPGEVP